MDSLGEVIYDKLIIFSDGKKLGGIINNVIESSFNLPRTEYWVETNNKKLTRTNIIYSI